MERALIVVAAFTFGVSARNARTPAGEDESVTSKLRMITASTERIEAEYYAPKGGIHIFSEVSSSGDAVRVRITTTSGELLFAVDRPLYSSGVVSIDGKEFLLLNETSDDVENQPTQYVVPPLYSRTVTKALKRDRLDKVLRYLNRETVNATARSAQEELLARPEVLLIKEAALALGNAGLRGVNNPAAMAFYTTALRFAKAVEGSDVSSGRSEGEEMPERLLSKKRVRREQWCSNSNSYCDVCPTGPDCHGLCGPGCHCWWFLCNDCCWNVGCYLHDTMGCFGQDPLTCWLNAPTPIDCTHIF